MIAVRIRTQLLMAAAGAALVALTVLAALAYVTRLSAAALLAQRDSQDVARNVASLLTLTQEYTLYGNERPVAQWHTHYAQLAQTVQAAVQREAAPDPALRSLHEHVLDLQSLFQKLEETVRQGPSDLAQRRRELMIERLVAATQEMVEARHRWASAIGAQQAHDQRIFTAIVLSAPAVLLAVIVGLGLVVLRGTLQPLARLQSTALAIQGGDLSVRCDRGERNELGDAARAVDAMALSLLGANQTLQQEVEQRREAEHRLRLVMESSPLGMCVSDAQGQCLFTNAAWQRIAGLGLEQSLGGGWAAALHPDDRARVTSDRRTAGGPQVSEHRYQRPDGRIVWVRDHIAPMHRDGAWAGLVSTVEDITDRRRLDETLAARTTELARSNEELERFAYVASHDLQEPLRMVTSYGQLLMRRHHAQLNTDAQEFLGFVVDGGKRAQALISDLLSLARINSQARPVQPVALAAVLDDTLRQLGARMLETGASVTRDALPTVAADARQLGQVFLNLIGNALKFHGTAAPRIHVGAAHEHGAWRISITDNGIGIEPRFFERIFVMFQRLHLRSDYEGTGIGLAICKKVVERHGGCIGVQSEPGRGSTFFFTLPDLLPAQPAPQFQSHEMK